MGSKGKWLSHEAVQKVLTNHPETFVVAFERGELSIELYQPRGEDLQNPHTRDEVYMVVKGRGDFFCAGETKSFQKGDVLFAPAHAEHRFVDFTEDYRSG